MSEITREGIGIFDRAYSVDYCQRVIAQFEYSNSMGQTWGRDESSPLQKSDTASSLDSSSRYYASEHSPLITEFNTEFFERVYPEYTKQFAALNEISRHGIVTYKVQKTLPGGGYHVWHCEADSLERSRRLSTYILYLNDVAEGGETEFLSLSKRVKPKAGTLVLFPSGYVYTHRGNPPLSGTKYILTGWLEFV